MNISGLELLFINLTLLFFCFVVVIIALNTGTSALEECIELAQSKDDLSKCELKNIKGR